jgi:hypothetical protein
MEVTFQIALVDVHTGCSTVKLTDFAIVMGRFDFIIVIWTEMIIRLSYSVID